MARIGGKRQRTRRDEVINFVFLDPMQSGAPHQARLDTAEVCVRGCIAHSTDLPFDIDNSIHPSYIRLPTERRRMVINNKQAYAYMMS
jgi:hypothetical protein